ATGDAILVMLPVDLQDPPELLPEFVKLWEQGYDVVAGERTQREEALLMRTVRHVFYYLVNKLAGFEIPRNVGEFQLIDKKVLDVVLKREDHYPYIRGMIAECGYRRTLVPYVWKERKRGVSKIGYFELIDQALNGLFSFTSVPLRLCTFLGFSVAALCFLYAAINVLTHFIRPELAPQGVTSIIVGLFFLVGLQLIFIGVLGEYVTSIHKQVRRGPLVVERECINILSYHTRREEIAGDQEPYCHPVDAAFKARDRAAIFERNKFPAEALVSRKRLRAAGAPSSSGFITTLVSPSLWRSTERLMNSSTTACAQSRSENPWRAE